MYKRQPEYALSEAYSKKGLAECVPWTLIFSLQLMTLSKRQRAQLLKPSQSLNETINFTIKFYIEIKSTYFKTLSMDLADESGSPFRLSQLRSQVN